MEHEFELQFRLETGSMDVASLVERLFEAGCDDALIGTGRPGRIALIFSRKGPSAEEAVISAVEGVRQAVPGAVLTALAHEVLTLNDLMRRLAKN